MWRRGDVRASEGTREGVGAELQARSLAFVCVCAAARACACAMCVCVCVSASAPLRLLGVGGGVCLRPWSGAGGGACLPEIVVGEVLSKVARGHVQPERGRDAGPLRGKRRRGRGSGRRPSFAAAAAAAVRRRGRGGGGRRGRAQRGMVAVELVVVRLGGCIHYIASQYITIQLASHCITSQPSSSSSSVSADPFNCIALHRISVVEARRRPVPSRPAPPTTTTAERWHRSERGHVARERERERDPRAPPHRREPTQTNRRPRRRRASALPTTTVERL